MTFREAARVVVMVLRDLPQAVQERGAENVGVSAEELEEAIGVVERETNIE